jgi:uncharacterized protein (TIGR02246 family)
MSHAPGDNEHSPMLDTRPSAHFSSDEKAIRDLVIRWQRATASGDLQVLLSLMSEDVVFLTAGQPPLRGKDAFANAFRSALQHVRIDATSEIQEIRVAGDMAYCWNHFDVKTTSLEGGSPKYRRGHTLTILRKTRTGDWVLTRDANMLAVENG